MCPSASFTGKSTMAPSSVVYSSRGPLDSSVPRPVQAVSPSIAQGRTTRILADATGDGKLCRTRRNRVMSSAKVFIFAPVEEARDSHKRLESEGCELRLGKVSWDTPQGNGEPELIRMAQGAHALMGTSIRNVPISRRIMESSPELRVVAKYTGGVAEGTITAMLTMLKKVRERDRHLKDGGAWRDPKLQGAYLGSRADGYAGITLGLIGLGRIGSRIATLLRPWQMRILATDPYVPESKFARMRICH